MTKNRSKTTDFSLSGISTAMKKLRSPESYVKGVAHQNLLLPDQILFFPRHHSSELKSRRDSHHRFVLILNLRTKGTVLLNEQLVRLEPGEAVFVFPYQFHGYSDFSAADISWLFLTFEKSPSAELEKIRSLKFSLTPEILRTVWCMLEIFLEKGPQRMIDNRLSLWASLLLEEVLRMPVVKNQKVAKDSSLINRKFLEKFNRIAGSTEKGLPRISVLARKMGLSPSRFRAAFKQRVGMTCKKYLERKHLFRAAALIHYSEMNFSEIADECGYPSLYTFSRSFKKVFGRRPREYRKHVRK